MHSLINTKNTHFQGLTTFMAKYTSFVLWSIVAVLISSAFSVFFVDQFHANKYEGSNLNYEKIINNTGHCLIGNNGGYVKIFYLADGSILVEHKSMDPNDKKSFSRDQIIIGDKLMIDKWKIYIKNDSLIWIKCGDNFIKSFNNGLEMGTIQYNAFDEKHLMHVPKDVIEKLNSINN